MEEQSWKIGRRQMVSRIMQQQKSGQHATISTFLYDMIAVWDIASMTELKPGGATRRLTTSANVNGFMLLTHSHKVQSPGQVCLICKPTICFPASGAGTEICLVP